MPLRRSFIILNDPNCPLQITSFGLRTEQPDRLLENFAKARLVYVIHWGLMPRSLIAAWEVRNIVFDPLNRFVIDNHAGPGDAEPLAAGEEYETDRIGWWKSEQTDQLGRWLTSIVFVTTIRTGEGKVWSYDKQALRSAMKELSLEPPADYQW
jgi:hypothetical protein